MNKSDLLPSLDLSKYDSLILINHYKMTHYFKILELFLFPVPSRSNSESVLEQKKIEQAGSVVFSEQIFGPELIFGPGPEPVLALLRLYIASETYSLV